MKFKVFFITLLGLILIGISIGYILGFYIQKTYSNDAAYYLSVLFMGGGCFMAIYGSMYLNK